MSGRGLASMSGTDLFVKERGSASIAASFFSPSALLDLGIIVLMTCLQYVFALSYSKTFFMLLT